MLLQCSDKHCSLQGKIDLLTKTNMVDYAMDIYQNLHGKAAPQSMKDQRSQVQSPSHCCCLPDKLHQGASMLRIVPRPQHVGHCRGSLAISAAAHQRHIRLLSI